MENLRVQLVDNVFVHEFSCRGQSKKANFCYRNYILERAHEFKIHRKIALVHLDPV
jgi:hypothetical protein